MSEETNVSRRRFLSGLSFVGAAASLLPRHSFGVSLDSLAAKGHADSTVTGQTLSIPLQDPKYAALAIFGKAVYVDAPGEQDPIIVRRGPEGKVISVSSACTHKGCRLNLPKKGKIVCPCHRSTFGEDGKLIKGPAKTDLRVFPAELVGKDTIRIHLRPK